MSLPTMVLAIILCGGGPGCIIGGVNCLLTAWAFSSGYGVPMREYRDTLRLAAVAIPLGLVLSALAFLALPHMP